MSLTPRQAKEIIRQKLIELDLPTYQLTAKTIGFADLARTSCIFVKLHGWTPNPLYRELDLIARASGFRIEA
jgi:hypothetical protein